MAKQTSDEDVGLDEELVDDNKLRLFVERQYDISGKLPNTGVFPKCQKFCQIKNKNVSDHNH